MAQTKTVTKTVSGNALTESLKVPTGKTIEVSSGGTLVIKSGATINAEAGSTITGFSSGSGLTNFASTLSGGTLTFAGTLTTGRTITWRDLAGTVALTSDLSSYLTTADAATGYQPLDQMLTDIAALTDPGGDRLLFWDDSEGKLTLLQLGTNLSITGTTLNASGGAGLTNIASAVTGDTLTFGATLTAPQTITFPDETGTVALTSNLIDYQPVNASLTYISGLATQTFGMGLLELDDAGAVRSYLNMGAAALRGVSTDTATDLVERVSPEMGVYGIEFFSQAAMADPFTTQVLPSFLTENEIIYLPEDSGILALQADLPPATRLLPATEPEDDRIAFWDASATAPNWLVLGTNVSIAGNVLNVATTEGLANLDSTISGALLTLTGTLTAPRTITFPDSAGTVALTSQLTNGNRVEIGVALSDEATPISTGTGKVSFRMPHGMTLTAVRLSAVTAPTGSTIIVDINENGSTILSTKLSIDAGEKTSTTAATAAVISDSSLADDMEITFDFDQVGSSTPGAGLKVWLIGTY